MGSTGPQAKLLIIILLKQRPIGQNKYNCKYTVSITVSITISISHACQTLINNSDRSDLQKNRGIWCARRTKAKTCVHGKD